MPHILQKCFDIQSIDALPGQLLSLTPFNKHTNMCYTIATQTFNYHGVMQYYITFLISKFYFYFQTLPLARFQY